MDDVREITKDKAIEILKYLLECSNVDSFEDSENEALRMAIKALEQEPSEDVIRRQDVLDLAKKGVLVSNGNYESVCKAINELPSVNPTKTGHWIWCVGSHKCSNCEEYTCFSHKELLKYCPNCGARMFEPQESEDME